MPVGDRSRACADGRIDGQLSSIGMYDSLDLARWQEHVTMLNYSFEPIVVCASSTFWDRLSLKQRGLLVATLGESSRYHRELLAKEESESLEQIYDKGVSVVELIPGELDLFRRVVEKKYADMLPGIEESLIARVMEEAEAHMEPYLFRFYDNLGNAFLDAPPYSQEAYTGEKLPARAEGSALAYIGGVYDFDERYGIFCAVPSRLEYEVEVPPDAKIEFVIAVRPRAHRQSPDGIIFAVDLADRSGNESKRIYERTLDPFTNKVDRLWFDELLDINLPAGTKAKIIFSVQGAESSTEKSQNADKAYYAAVWANPVLYEEDEDTYRRNVILIPMDTLRADALRCYGNKYEASPTIDRMAQSGTMFTNCISQSTWTLPSHMSIMTSLYPRQHNMDKSGRKDKLNPGHLTMAEMMRDNGYNTVAFAESGLVDSIYGYNQGFNSYSNFWHVIEDKEKAAARDEAVDLKPLVFRDRIDLTRVLDDSMRTTHITFSKTLKWLKNRGGRKYFCFLHTYEVHMPYYENPYARLFSPKYRGAIPNVLNQSKMEALWGAMESGSFKITQKEREHLWALYSAQLRFADDFISQLLNALKDAGLDRDTLIIFTSDHGERLLEHGWFVGHGSVPYEEVVSVPLVMDCASIVPSGKKIETQVATIDILPTVLDFAGVKKPSILEGVSLYLSIIKGDRLPEKRPIFMENHSTVALKLEGKKFIYDLSNGKSQLFDLTSDPGEIENVAEDSRETEYLERVVRGFIRKRPRGYHLIFKGDDLEHTFEGELVTEGAFKRFFIDGVDWSISEKKPLSYLKFKAVVTGSGEQMLGFDIYPENARVTLDLLVDGKRDASRVFAGDSLTNPGALPWEIDDSVQSTQNPHLFAGPKKAGCYVFYIDSIYRVDTEAREGLRVAASRKFGIDKLEAVGPGEASGERIGRLQKQLEVLGQANDLHLDKAASPPQDEEEKKREEKMRQRLKALGYVE